MPEADTTVIKVVENDSFLTLITVPPFVLWFEVSPWEFLTSSSGLAGTWRTMIPDASNIGVFIRLRERLVDLAGLD